MVKPAWFRRYLPAELPARFDRLVQSWDTASKASELADFSVCTSWGIKEKYFYLLGVLRRRMDDETHRIETPLGALLCLAGGGH